MTRYSRDAYDMKARMQRYGLRQPQLDGLLQTSWSDDVWEEHPDGLLFDCYSLPCFVSTQVSHIETMHYELSNKHTQRLCAYFFWRTDTPAHRRVFPWLRW